MARTTIVEETNDPSFAWCDLFVHSLDILETVVKAGVKPEGTDSRYILNVQISTPFAKASGPCIDRIAKEFSRRNGTTPIQVDVGPLEIILVFEKRDRAKLLRKENPLNDGITKMPRL